jgi:hypothetical protein
MDEKLQKFSWRVCIGMNLLKPFITIDLFRTPLLSFIVNSPLLYDFVTTHESLSSFTAHGHILQNITSLTGL